MAKAKAATAARKKATPPQGGFDLAASRAQIQREEEGITFPVLDRDGTPLTYGDQPVTLTVRGAEAPTFRRMADDFQRRFYGERLQGITDPEERREAIAEAAAERAVEFDRQVRAPNILAWYGFVENGEPVELTPERALQLIETPFLRSQIMTAQEAPEFFFDEPSES